MASSVAAFPQRSQGPARSQDGHENFRFRVASAAFRGGTRDPRARDDLLALALQELSNLLPLPRGQLHEVAEEIAKYVRAGFTHYILDIPAEEDDLLTAGLVFQRAAERTALPALVPCGEPAPLAKTFSTDSQSPAA